jgi:hypothetical protein
MHLRIPLLALLVSIRCLVLQALQQSLELVRSRALLVLAQCASDIVQLLFAFVVEKAIGLVVNVGVVGASVFLETRV